MPFQLSEVQPEDIHELAELDDAAMAGWAMAQAMELEANKKGETRQQMIVGMMEKAFEEENPNGKWLKVTDEESGKMAAIAAWRWDLKDQRQSESKSEAATESQAKEQTRTVFSAMREDWQVFQKEHFPSEKYFNLMVLCTHPEWQRRGAGGLLVKWGCDKADEIGAICVLQATAAGLGLYLKNGFEIVRETELDLRPFGVDDDELRRSMIRRATRKQR